MATIDKGQKSTQMKRILVVEDDVQMSKFIQFKLNYLGYEVVGDARNCHDAITRAALLKPDLILMDIMLDGGDDGIDAAHKIIQQQQVPIVYLTAYEDDELFQRAKITEPFGYLIKPFNDRDLKIVLETSFYRDAQEKRIMRAFQKLLDVLDSSLDAMITYGFEGNIIEFNHRAASLFGFERQSSKSQVIQQLFSKRSESSLILGGDPDVIVKIPSISLTDIHGQVLDADMVVTPVKGADKHTKARLLVARIH